MSVLPDISRHLHQRDGFCHPDWDAIAECIEETVPESNWQEAWRQAARQWVERLRDELGGGYEVHETPNFLILSEAPKRLIKDACKSFEASLTLILRHLPGVASDEGYGKHVVLMFTSLDDYYRYIMFFHPDGDHPMSGGMCLGGEGYLHFAFPTTDYSSYRSVLVHELTHGCLAHLPLPVWLNEALAMRMEGAICQTSFVNLDRETYEQHRLQWDAESIQWFWTGESWGMPGDIFDLSYTLAKVLWRKIEVDLSPSREALLSFVASANAKDAGEAACQACFGLSLGDLVASFLGEGDWIPKPADWPTPEPLAERENENLSHRSRVGRCATTS